MAQNFYIESDEEIISVIGRLRHSRDRDNFFIFPKRSLVLQSIINLRLFQREAEKIGKKITIVTQDEVGMNLALKVGIPTEHYTDDFSQKIPHLELVASQTPVKKTAPPVPSASIHAPKLEELGTNEFYTEAKQTTAPQILKETGQALRIRNASPPKQTSLNSLRPLDTQSQAQSTGLPPKSMNQNRPSSVGVSKGHVVAGVPFRNDTENGRETRLKHFFTDDKQPKILHEGEQKKEQDARLAPHPVPSKKVGGILFILGGVSLLSLVGVLIFLFLPRATVHVVPYKTTQGVNLQFEGRFEGPVIDDGTLLVRAVEKSQEITFSQEATGVGAGTKDKARGTVILSNAFSEEAQPLVATTRLESPDGKIFRLTEGVTVPGMKNNTPGTITTSVISDQEGVAYNIGPSIFTIPGFKGSPKFAKFSAQSTKALSGGSDATANDTRVISKEDLEKAEALGEKNARDAFLSEALNDLSRGEKLLEENLEVTSQSNAGLPLSGTVGQSFEYKKTFRVRGFIFSEEAIKEKIMMQGEQMINDIAFRPTMVTLSYGEALADFEGKKLRLKVYATVDSESVIDTDKVMTAILGKKSDSINESLAAFPEIKKMEIIFKPQWFSSTVPSSEERVTIVVDPGSAE